MRSGWRSIEIDNKEEDGEEKPGKGKGGLKNCPKGVGLKDGGVLAFRFGDGNEWLVTIPSFEDHDREMRARGGIPGFAEALAMTAESR